MLLKTSRKNIRNTILILSILTSVSSSGKNNNLSVTDSSNLIITKFYSKIGAIIKYDSVWDTNKKIHLQSLPTFITINLAETDKSQTRLICIISEIPKIYDTIRVENNSVNFFNLSGGNYDLTFINLKNNHQAKVSFSIEPVFWEKWWFSPFVFLVISVVLGIIFYFLSLIRLRQQLRLQSVRHELEIKALRAQMNPHFIFNCMNTIDAYILRKKFLEASDYLQKFSKLIRKILENSESQTISIEQEIQTLKLYVELEQERFSHSFVSYFDIEPELMTNDYQIPSLVLQPFVENAILHGIRHLTEQKGLISVILKKMKNDSGEDILFCQIQDNGVGRKASSIINEQRQASHKSMGVNVTLERIRTYQAIYGNKMETIVSDLAKGTQVEIKLPLFLSC